MLQSLNQPAWDPMPSCWLMAARVITGVISAWLTTASIVAGNPVVGQNFDGSDLGWRLTEGRCRVVSHDRIQGGARSAGQVERMVVTGPVAESARLLFAVPRLAVLDELEASVWVKASRPDLQIAAQLVLPRSTGTDGRTATAIVRGAAYRRTGHWQQLHLTNVPALLADEVRILRAAPGAKIDPRQAYVDAIVLVVPADPKGVEVLTDDLEVDGVLHPRVPVSTGVHQTSFPAPAVPAANAPAMGGSATNRSADLPTSSADAINAASVRLHGSVLMVEDKPFFPRVIQWNAEPLEYLAKRGFNVVQLSELPAPELSTDARQHGLSFLCPAPRADAIGDGPVGHADDRVLAWLLDDPAIEVDPAYGRNWAALVRQRDVVRGRPIVVAPQGNWDAAANIADIILATHPRVSRMSPPDFDRWLAGRTQMVRQGMPMWAAAAVEFGNQAGEQACALAETLSTPPGVDRGRFSEILHVACLRGCRGIVMQSGSALSEGSPRAGHRAAVLELLNRRLQLLEPWIAGGKVVGEVESTDSAAIGVVLLVDRARVLVPIAAENFAGGAKPFRPADAINSQSAFVLPGIPEACQAYWVSPASFKPLPAQRVAGGTRVVLPSKQAGMALLTEDPRVVQTFRQHVAQNAPTTARLFRSLVEQEAKRLNDAGRDLHRRRHVNSIVLQSVSTARDQLRRCDLLMASGRADAAFELAEQIDRNLRVAAGEQRRLLGSPAALVSHPLAISEEQLLEYAQFTETSASLRGGENLLYAGDFEDLGQMMQFGWQRFTYESPGIVSRVALAANSPQHGSYSLELYAGAASQTPSAAQVTSAPVWVVSHPIPVDQGQIIAVTGWVCVDEPIAESVDGLEITDSLGGPELALNVRQTEGWQPFQLLRGVPESTELRVTFALTGLGTARIDGVMVRVLDKPVARRLPPVSPPEGPIGPNTAERSGPLFIAPAAR